MLALGRLILSHLSASGEPKQDFAARAGISPQQLSAWIRPETESLREYPEPKTMKGLAEALGVTRHELIAVISEDVGYLLEDIQVDPTLALLIAAAGPLSDKHKARLIQIAKDYGEG